MSSRKIIAVLVAAIAISGTGFVSSAMAASIHASPYGLLSDLKGAIKQDHDNGFRGYSKIDRDQLKHDIQLTHRPSFLLTNTVTGESWNWSPGSDNGYKPGQLMKLAIQQGDVDRSSFTFSITPSPAAVPVPAAVWLFGSGLIGLIGIARRKI